MKFKDAKSVEDVVWSMRFAELTRGTNRALINNILNGFPPFTEIEAKENNVNTNVNFLEATKLAHDARRQFSNAFTKPGNFFKVQVRTGPVHKRAEYSAIITEEMNRILRGSRIFFEVMRSTFASLVAHGIAPTVWPDRFRWRPTAVGVEDVLVPSGTLLTMENLPFFAVFRKYTPAQLYRCISGKKVDKGWNVSLVKKALAWADKELQNNLGYNDTLTPEKMMERFKEDLGFYGSDAVPTVDAWDFYYWSDEGKQAGWRRRIVLDCPTAAEAGAEPPKFSNSTKSKIGTRGELLYDSGERVYAKEMGEIIHWQFADCSAVAPFRYHSVRSLGFLLYAVCHLQNRMRCKINDAAFEALLNYFRVSNPDDSERVTKIDLMNFGVVPDGVQFVTPDERWKVDHNVVSMVMSMNRQTMADNSASFTQDFDFGKEDAQETATAVMAKVNSSAALVASMLNQAYTYAFYQYREIARRYTIPNSSDADVRKFRRNVLSKEVPEECLNSEHWDIEVERVLGGGNKTLEIAQIDRLMAARPLFDPEPQKEILHNFVLATTDDPDRANRWVPLSGKKVTDSVYEAQLAMGSLMMGLPVAMKTGQNHVEVIEVLLADLSTLLQRVEQQQQGMATENQVIGFRNVGMHVQQHIAKLAEDPKEKERVRVYSNDLGKMMNIVKGYEQRLAEEGGGNGKMDPKTMEAMAKVEGMRMQAEAKAANTRESHAQRTAQRQVQWEAEQVRTSEQHQIDMAREREKLALEAQATALKALKNRQQAEPESGEG